jgi:hypothetical protein
MPPMSQQSQQPMMYGQQQPNGMMGGRPPMMGGQMPGGQMQGGPMLQQQQQQQWGAVNEEAQVNEILTRFPPGAVDKATARRFLTARQWDMAKSTQLLHENMQWKRSFGCPVDPKSCLGELIKGKTFLHGQDRVGNALVYHFCRKQDPSERDLQEAVQSVVFWAEQCEKEVNSKTGKITLVFVRSGTNQGNADPNLARAIAPILQNNFPERLDRVLVYPTGLTFNALWFAAQFVLDASTRKKVTPISDQYELFTYIAPENLLTEFGGLDQVRWVPLCVGVCVLLLACTFSFDSYSAHHSDSSNLILQRISLALIGGTSMRTKRSSTNSRCRSSRCRCSRRPKSSGSSRWLLSNGSSSSSR